MQLWGYQQQAIDRVRQAYLAGHKGVCLVMPTAGGKTVCFSSILKSLSDKGKKALLLAHRQELIYQATKTLGRFGIETGIQMGRLATNSLAPVQVGTVQTIRKRDLIQSPDLIVVDEAHLINSPSYLAVMNRYPNARRLLVTATPIRLDGKPLRDFASEMIVATTIRELMALGQSSGFKQGLVTPREFPARIKPDTQSVHKKGNDYDAKELEQKIMTVELMGDLVKSYRQYADGRKFIGFAVTVEHSKACAETFCQDGIPVAHLDGSMNDFQRKRILDDLRNGQLKGVFNVNILCEGYDDPTVSCVIMARPTQSEALYIQQAGRGLRVCPDMGKTDCIILDNAGNIDAHMSVTVEREWSLDGKVKKPKQAKKQANTKEDLPCPSCWKFNPPDAYNCSHCGFELRLKATTEVINLDAELYELDTSDVNYQIRQQYWHLSKRARENGWKQGAAFHKLLNTKRLINGIFRQVYTIGQLADVLGYDQVPYVLRQQLS